MSKSRTSIFVHLTDNKTTIKDDRTTLPHTGAGTATGLQHQLQQQLQLHQQHHQQLYPRLSTTMNQPINNHTNLRDEHEDKMECLLQRKCTHFNKEEDLYDLQHNPTLTQQVLIRNSFQQYSPRFGKMKKMKVNINGRPMLRVPRKTV